MCGIIAYNGEAHALPILLDGLNRLDYRGYDSAGVALENGELDIIKRSGTIDELVEACPENHPARRGIGHTRWSTHGPPTDANAHPHVDCTEHVAVVHNGIIENYDEIQAELDGHTFLSDTDTEVIPHLLERELEDGVAPRTALLNVTAELSGSYAFCATMGGEDELFAARDGSPLVVGHGADGCFFASDVPAFLDRTREVSYLQDGDLAVAGANGVEVLRDETWIEPEIETVEWEAEAAEKGGFAHYMRKEIHEQPEALRQTISGRLDPAAGEVTVDLDLPAEYLRSLDELQFVACGTSAYAAAYGAQLFESLANIRSTVSIASEYGFSGGRDPWRTLAVAVTQSGETADTLGALERAGAAGTRTLAVTNVLGSSVTRDADDSVFIRAGPEIGVAATKTFASQVVTLAILAVAIGRKRGVLSVGSARTVLENLRSLPGAIQQILDREDSVVALAEEYATSDAFFFIGRQLGHPVAQEGALKLKEISYDHAEGFAAGELKHGPLALITNETPVLAVLTEGSRPDKTINNVKEVQARGAPVIAASSQANSKYVDERLPIPSAGRFEPLVANVYWQLFAYHIANLKDRPIDKPRNLAKSVTVE